MVADNIAIPHHLIRCRFIRVERGGKAAIDTGWQGTANYASDAGILHEWLASGGNYGVMVKGDICCIDADKPGRLQSLNDLLKDALVVKTGRVGGGFHLFFRCPGWPSDKIALHDPDTGEDIGDIRGPESPFFTVGPGSVHPSGRKYEVVRDPGELPTIDKTALTEALRPYIVYRENAEPVEKIRQARRGGGMISDALNLRPEMFLMPENHRVQGDRISGAHPVHGSETGQNLHIDTRQGVWHCFRCGSGGGALEALAVAEGIIQCGEAGPGCLDGHWKEIYDALRRHGYAGAMQRAGIDSSPVQSVAAVEREDGEKKPVAKVFRRTTDLGNSERFVDRFGDVAKYCPVNKSWYLWNGKRWERDELVGIMRLADTVARSIYEEAAAIDDKDKRGAVGDWARSTESQAKRSAMVAGAAPYCAIRINDFDSDGDLLNFQNGTLDMKNGEFRGHRKDDLITKMIPCDYDPSADCPLWWDHLKTVFGGDAGMISDFQKIMGYVLLDGNPEQIIVIFHGGGENGKSVTSETVKNVLGDYAASANPDSFMLSRQSGANVARSDLVGIMDKRLVIVGESKERQQLDESVIKMLTGGDTAKFRNLYEEEREFRPSFTVVMHTNHRPQIRGTDHAIWRRIWLVPFDHRIPEEKKDTEFNHKLLKEKAGIINWLLCGLQEYFRDGRRLRMPESIKNAVAAYRAEEDPLSAFILDKCIEDADAGITRADFNTEYQKWCAENSETPIPPKRVVLKLRERGLQEVKISKVRGWKGLRLKTQLELK